MRQALENRWLGVAAGAASVLAGLGCEGAEPPAPPAASSFEAPAPAVSGPAIAIPWTVTDAGPVVEARVNGRGPYRFALDTGATGDGLVTRRLASALGLEAVGEAVMGDPSGAIARRGTAYSVATIEIGGLPFAGRRMVAFPEADTPPWEEAGVDGVVGYGLLRGWLVMLDYPGNRLVLARGALAEPDGKAVVAYTSPDGIPRLPVFLGALALEADLDTGSQGGFLVPEAVAGKIAWAEAPRVVGRIRTPFSEAEIRAGRARDAWRLGSIEIAAPEIEISSMLPRANIGTRLLTGMKITLDTVNARARVEGSAAAAAAAAVPRRKTYGVMLERGSPDAIEVADVVPQSRAEAAGIRPGDRIIAINGTAVASMPEGGPLAAFRASPIRLGIDRAGTAVEVTMDLDAPSPSDDAPVVAPRRRFTKYDGWTDLAGLLEQVRRDAQDPALAAAIVRGGRIEKAAVGVREAGTDRAVSPSDLFHLGSAAKPMTATLIGRLVEMGKLDWSSTVGALLPDLAMRPEYRAVTVEQLMRHRGGIPRFMNVTKAQVERYDKAGPTAVLQRAAFVADLLQMEPAGPAGSFAYSNAGYGLLGHIAERVMERPWEDLMRDIVFVPLGMKSAGFGWPATAARPDQPRGHFETPEGLRVQKLDEYRLGAWLSPAGNIHASIEDVARFAAAHLAGMRGVDGVLEAATIRRLHEPPEVAPGDEAYAAGWEIVPEWTDEPFHGHGGSAGTFRCHIALFAASDLAVVACDNAGGETEPSPPLQVVLSVAQ